MQNANCIADLIFGGVCHRFPEAELRLGRERRRLDALLSSRRATGSGATARSRSEHPEYDLLPSEYFRRQIYGCFWFEERACTPARSSCYPDNLLWETDFPHPTCQHPGPTGGLRRAPAPTTPSDALARRARATVQRKVLHDNAAALYGLN